MVWRPISTAKKSAHHIGNKVDLWMSIPASPMSMGLSHAFRVSDAWHDGKSGGWLHYHGSEQKLLRQDCITHWMPRPRPPNSDRRAKKFLVTEFRDELATD